MMMMRNTLVKPLAGLLSVALAVVVVVVVAMQFSGDFANSQALTVLAPRAGLVMNPDARVEYRGVQVGTVSSIEELPGDRAALHLAIDTDRMHVIPSNVTVHVAASTVFGAKMVLLAPPADPSASSVQPGQVLDTDRVTVEINTIFEQLVGVLSRIQPEKLNETLGAISSALNGRGHQFGQTLSDLNSILGQLEPHLGALSKDLATAPKVLGAYADAAPDLLSIAKSTTATSQTILDHAPDLDALLVSVTGLANLGNEVLTENRPALTDVLKLLVPTTGLTNQYNDALRCAVGGMRIMGNGPPLNVPGVQVLAGFLWGQDRYHYPDNLPKVAATGGPFCTDLPKVPYETIPPFVVTDTGVNPFRYNNPGIVFNSDGLKRLLFGPADGPPRNGAQIGQPG